MNIDAGGFFHNGDGLARQLRQCIAAVIDWIGKSAGGGTKNAPAIGVRLMELRRRIYLEAKALAQGVRRFDSPLWLDYLSLVTSPRASVPVNYSTIELDPVEEAKHEVSLARNAANLLQSNGVPMDGDILEIGPGKSICTALTIGANARSVAVADKYVTPWDNRFHPALYRAVRELGGSTPRMDKIISSGSYDPQAIKVAVEAADHMESFADGSVDVIFSNAVLEHVHPIHAAAKEMARITRAGGYGVHQVDFRYHRDFSQPLEHLLMSRSEFSKLLDATSGEAGCQTRVEEMADAFKSAGFTTLKTSISLRADDAYRDSFMPRLRAARRSPYRDASWDYVAPISACFVFRKMG